MKNISMLALLLFLLSIPSANAITLQQGVSFNTTGTNTTYIAGANLTVDKITVTQNILNITNSSGDFIMSAIPSSGSLNITILGFNASYKEFNISSNVSGITVSFVIGNLSASSPIVFKKTNNYWNTFTSNSSGYINFTYSGGYSNIQFEALQDTTAPTVSLSTSSSSIYQTQSVTISCSATDTYLSTTSLKITKPNNDQVTATCNQPFTGTSVTGTYTVTYSATDTSGNSASASQAFTVNSYGGGSSAAQNKTAANKTQANATVVSPVTENRTSMVEEPKEPEIKQKAQEKISEVKSKAISTEAQAKLSEAEAAFNKGDYSEAYDLAVEAEGLIRTVEAQEPEAQRPYVAYVIAAIILVIAAYVLSTKAKKKGRDSEPVPEPIKHEMPKKPLAQKRAKEDNIDDIQKRLEEIRKKLEK